MVHEIDNIESLRNGNVLVDFYSSNCGPCKMLNPVLEELSLEFPDIKVAKVEITKNYEASQAYGVMSVPTVMFLQNSKVKEIYKGFSNRCRSEIKNMVEKHLVAA